MYTLILSVEIMSELGIGYVLKRSALAIPFMLAAVPIIFTYPGPELVSFNLGPWMFSISAPGLERFISITFKSWLSVQAAIVLAASTPFPDLLVAMRAIKLPRMLVAIFSLMWRYLFVLADEAIRLNRARAARSGHPDNPDARVGGSIAWRARVTGGIAGSLFLRALERSDRIYMAMVSRGYDGEVRSFPLPKLGAYEWVVLGFGIAVLSMLLLLAFLL
jgi:cobalt/nickel transport system permease protein